MRTEITSERLIKLIEDAAKIAGNEAKLAGLLEETRHNLSSWKHGRRTCPLEAQILMADIAGLDPVEVMRLAVLEKNAGTTKGERLVMALNRKSTQAGAATSWLLQPDLLSEKIPGVMKHILGFM